MIVTSRHFREQEQFVSTGAEEVFSAQQQVFRFLKQGSKAKGFRTVYTKWTRIKAAIESQEGGWNPRVSPLTGLQVLANSRHAATTIFNYAKKIRTHFSDDFEHVPSDILRDVMNKLETDSNTAPRPHAARAATASEVRELIGDLSKEEQRTIYRLWTTAARYEDSTKWVCTPYWEYGMMRLTNPRPKCDPRGRVPHHIWVPLQTQNDVMLYQRTTLEYWKLLVFLHRHSRGLTAHSFRKGAIQELERHHRPGKVAHLSLHTARGEVRGIQTYLSSTPRAPLAQLKLALVRQLQASLRCSA